MKTESFLETAPILLSQVKESTHYSLRKDPLFIIGLILAAFSITLFGVAEWEPIPNNFAFFVAHYSLTCIYGTTLLISKAFKWRGEKFKQHAHHLLVWLVLSLISAYALNHNIALFDDSSPWLCGYLTIAIIGCLGYGFLPYGPSWLQRIMYFIFGATWLLCLYLSLFLMPIYPLGAIAFFGLGISLHVFVPLALVFHLSLVFRLAWRDQPTLARTFLGGMLVPLILVIAFCLRWHQVQKQIEHLISKDFYEQKSPLPTWVKISQGISSDWVTHRLLKTELVYQPPSDKWLNWNIDRRDFDERRQHDPLVVIACWLMGSTSLSVEERIHILEANYDNRHQTEERLWTGDNLKTSQVSSNVQLFPQFRLAYTEMMLSIRNRSSDTWRNEQEAIYTFDLSEGSAVTALSLWIDGREEKALLTTKDKADSAYRTIVGVEMRDPSVVHWQEGNRVSVRVFPCSPKEERRFKIGVTSPLSFQNGRLHYQNVTFRGPSAIGASEEIQIRSVQSITNFTLPLGFTMEQGGVYRYQGAYHSDWAFHFPAPALATTAFTFNEKSYQLATYQPAYEAFSPTAFYLDINEAWSAKEVQEVWEMAEGKPVYTSRTGQLIRLTDSNWNNLSSELRNHSFSLFPFYAIKNPSSSLLISKGTPQSPNLKELKDTPFASELKKYLAQGVAVRLFNLNTTLSPYLKSLKEFRLLTYAEGNQEDLQSLLQHHHFISSPENNNTVWIQSAHLLLQQTPTAARTNPHAAPDHLLRLFAYNDIMRRINQHYFEAGFYDNTIQQEAEQAYVVSPVSSLIVLEKPADYEKFNIKASQNSLQNASVKAAGSVPEPHEWMLILLTISIVAWLIQKTYFA